jgi:hypothetical protein
VYRIVEQTIQCWTLRLLQEGLCDRSKHNNNDDDDDDDENYDDDEEEEEDDESRDYETIVRIIIMMIMIQVFMGSPSGAWERSVEETTSSSTNIQ